MFTIQFCVCFYSILYICQSHFTVNFNKNITKKDETKMKTNFDTINTTDEAKILENNTTVETLAVNVSKIHLGIDNRRKTDEKNMPINNVEESLLKKNYSIFGINLTINDSSNIDKHLIVTGKTVEPADYLENKTANRIKSKVIEGAPKNYRVEEQNTTGTVNNDITTKILQNIVNLTMIYKNNVDMTKVLQKDGIMTNISQTTDNMTIIFGKNNDIIKTVEENGFHRNVESNNLTKKNENDDTLKKVKKRDISLPGLVPIDYNPQDFQNHDAKNYQNYDIYKNIADYDMPKNIQQHNPQNIAQKPEMAKKVQKNNKPFSQNYEIKNKNIIDKTYMPKKEERTRFYDDSQKILPQIQTRFNNELVKKSLDEFTMVRRKTHFTIPDIPIQNDISKREIERYQDLNYNSKFHKYYDEELNYYTKYIPDNALYPPDQENKNKINLVYEEVESMPNKYRELNKILGRQKEIIEKLTKLQMRQGQVNDFEKLMNEVKKKQESRNYTQFKFDTNTRITTTTSTTTEKPTTILTMFDETEVKLALKKDPNVRRLLKIGNLKREKYLKRVKDYLERRNHSTSPGY